MSNTLIIDSLNTLFSMSNTAVLGAQEQFVAFMNPAAQELFRGDRTNHKLSELLQANNSTAVNTGIKLAAHHASRGHGIRNVRDDRKTARHHFRNIIWCVPAVFARAAR